VVRDAEAWKEPIRITHEGSDEPRFVTDEERVVFTDAENDSAVILFPPEPLNLPTEILPLLPYGRSAKVGVEVGWLGYPSVAPRNLCFFSGNISGKQESSTYLIDGVAINGVSGGPVFYRDNNKGLRIIGTISAYLPNVANGETLPGLSFAHGVAYFHDTIGMIQSIDEARVKQREQERETDGTTPSRPNQPESDSENESTH